MRLIVANAIFILSGSAFAVSGLSFADAKKIWEGSKDKKEYQGYLSEFVQFNNRLQLDTKDGCFALGKEPVELMLVITRSNNEKFAVVGQVLADTDSAKARCFKKSYNGVSTKIPPFIPFVLHMTMG